MKKNNKYLVLLSWLLVILVIIIIFSFSTQNSESSKNTSDGFIQETIGGINNGEVLDKIEEKYTWETFMVFVRKLGHFFEYSLLGLSLFNALYLTFENKIIMHWIYAILFSSIIANYDELYQSFTDRVSSGTDVCIDTLGAFIGASLLMLVIYLVRKHKFKKIKSC